VLLSSAVEALLIVDMQNDFVLPGSPVTVAGARATLPTIRKLLDVLRARGAPVVHVTRAYRPDGTDVEGFRRAQFLARPCLVPGTPGAQIVAELAPWPNEHVLVKPRFSAFMGTPLDLLLRRLGVGALVVCGTQYPNCIRATVMDAACLDYAVTLITDATSAQTPQVAAHNVADLEAIGVRCVPATQYLASG
jgi:nicotinamidase-related amidase